MVTYHVPCLRQGVDVSLEECARCPRMHHVGFQTRGRGAFVLCTADKASGGGTEREPPERPLRSAILRRELQTPLARLMRHSVVCVRSDLSVEALTSLLLEQGLTGVAVVDAAGAPLGFVAKTDLLRYRDDHGETEEQDAGRSGTQDLGHGMHGTELATATAGDIMTPMVFWLSDTASLSQAAALMAYEGIHDLVVLDQNNRVKGSVSSLDILRWLASSAGYALGDPR